eukprot:m.112842 g.112842  ORF g.112842 m.112842 type:complete len:390 (-) comp17044_c0_seq1:271-1440(-)
MCKHFLFCSHRARMFLRTTVTLLASALCIASVEGHGSVIMPLSRNSIDAETSAWSDGKHPETGTIEPYNCGCTNGSDICNNGQSCFWFSQGCTIGCSKCDGNGTRLPNFDHCPHESINATLNLPKYRTANQLAVPGSEQDIFKFNPWRAPGKAPVFDSCGMAGGNYFEVFNAGAYNTTKFAKQGDLGSKVLPKRPSGTVWKRGDTAKTRWQLTANHGGGYQYRLCPAESPLTEECFQNTPVKFATETHMIRFQNTSLDREIPAVLVKEGGGVGWMRQPIPYFTTNACDYIVPQGKHCDWKCDGCGAPKYAADGACPVNCAEHYPGLPVAGADKHITPNPLPGIDFHAFAIEDTLQVPSDIAAGAYVLGWRWDCETTSQIWTSCSDIMIV